MHYYNNGGAIVSASHRDPGLGTYLGETKDFSEETLRWPKLQGGTIVLDSTAKAAFETAEATRLRAELKAGAHAEMGKRVYVATVSYGGKTYSMQKYDEVLGLAAAASRGLTPAGGLKLSDVNGVRVAITEVDLDAIGQLMLDYLDTKNQEESDHIAAIEAADLAGLQSYDLTSGWT